MTVIRKLSTVFFGASDRWPDLNQRSYTIDNKPESGIYPHGNRTSSIYISQIHTRPPHPYCVRIRENEDALTITQQHIKLFSYIRS